MRVASAIAYPDGSTTTAAKLYEGRDLLRRGAHELELTINIGKLVSRQFQYVEMELLQMAKSCAESGAKFKVSLGRFNVPDDLKLITLKIAKRIEAAYFSLPYSESTTALLQPLLKERIEIRAAGGVNSLESALAARNAGCARLATAQSAAILEAWKVRLTPPEKSPQQAVIS